MSETADPALSQQRAALVAKVEQKLTHKSELDGKALILFFRVVLQDLPYAGLPSLLLDEHRDAIQKLVERAADKDIKIFSITGHTSEPGTDQYNQGLSLLRAQAVFEYLQQEVEQHAAFSDNQLYAQIRVQGQGEARPAEPSADGSDHPLNRRVEIAYRIKIVFPQPPGANVPRSRFWKIDFTAGGSGGLGGGQDGVNDHRAIGAEIGVGSLTMLPDGDHGQTQTIEKPLTYESLGISIGIFAVLKKLKFVTRFPKIKRLLENLDADLPGNYEHTANLLQNAGFAIDLASEGGGFLIDEPLSFEEMSRFNFAAVAGSLSLGAAGAGQLILLHSPNFFASTVIYGGGLKIAFPDASLDFVPVAWVQVNV